MNYITVGDVLDYVDEIKRNTFGRRVKLVWLNEIEYRIQSDVMMIEAESIVTVPDDDEHELLVPVPWHELYYDYLFMKLSEQLEESSEQNNRAATFEKAMARFMRWWADNYTPADGRAMFRGYYLVGPQGEQGIQGERGDMSFATFDMDEEGHLILRNADLLGTTDFNLNDNGHLEVTI